MKKYITQQQFFILMEKFILEVKWDNDADGTLTAMFSENDTEQMVFTLVLAIINAKK